MNEWIGIRSDSDAEFFHRKSEVQMYQESR